MPHRNRDTQGKLLWNTPTPPNSQPSLFFGDCYLPSLTTGESEEPLDEQPKIFEETIGEEEEPISHTQTMAENRNEEVSSIS